MNKKDRKTTKLLLFDFDGTLTIGMKVRYVDGNHLKSLGLVDRQVTKILELDKKFAKKYSGEISKEIDSVDKEIKVHTEHYRYFLKQAEIPEEFRHSVVESMIDNRMKRVSFEVEKETYEILKRLRKKFKLAILSNALPSRTREIQSTSLDKYVDKVCISNLIGLFKPNRDIYEYVANEFGLGIENLLLVDDKLETIEKTIQNGVQSIWINHNRGNTKTDLPFPTVSNLVELEEILGNAR
ncbi:HAD-IA family hydrolase [Candidatus Dojkabacteria bacterium]|nr:HAD-IA family hydrolase [Candidatus Dojkabacteria bacterium]